MAVFVRILALWSAFLLALPQGWCCFLALPTVRSAEAPAKVTACCHRSDGVKHEPKAQAPQPAKPLKACCCQPDTVAGPSAEKLTMDLGQVAAAAAAADVPIAHAPGDLVRGPYLLSPPLHLLHCVWLC
jgi:hypothetical protein